ncbi:MAG: hypothetical protein QM805_04225 [Pseudomonas sp.]
MKLNGDHVDAKVRIKNDIHLGEDTTAVIKVTTILGARYLAVYPAGAGELPDDNIDINHTEPPYDLQAALSDITHSYSDFNADP